jgi:hypothetical protein
VNQAHALVSLETFCDFPTNRTVLKNFASFIMKRMATFTCNLFSSFGKTNTATNISGHGFSSYMLGFGILLTSGIPFFICLF